MFTLSELAPLDQHRSRSKLLKPWWEVCMDYLLVLMLLTSVLACTEQLSRDRVVCLPSDPPSEGPGRRTNLVFQQYSYISQVCYHEVLPFCSRFLPQITLLQTLLLVAGGSFWLHFPNTSSRVEHFLDILAKCCESPWTSQTLSHAAQQDTFDAGGPVPCPSSPGSSTASSELRQRVSLDGSDGEQARALFERVRKFRTHCERSTVVYKVYLTQTALKVVMSTLMLSSSVLLLRSFSSTHDCVTSEGDLLGFSSFSCIHVLSSLLHKLMVVYSALLGLYGLLNVFALFWILHSSLLQYSSPLPGDVPVLRRDLAFLLHMLDQSDPLLVQHLAVFLSPAQEVQLMDQSLERRWSEERLRAVIQVDTGGRSHLELVALPRLPSALFGLDDLQVLTLEHLTDVRFTAQVSNMTSLRELHLHHCAAFVDPAALTVLQERLEVLHLTFTHGSEIPDWVLSLRGLRELHLRGRLSGGEGRGLGGVLRQLRVLVVQGELQRIPAELSHGLVKLQVHNDGAKLLAPTVLKRLVNLSELQLQECELQRLPSALATLSRLRTLDLRRNRLSHLEDLVLLAHLRRLSSLRLALNNIQAVPSSVAVLQTLELLDLSDNQLKTLPSALFGLSGLRRLLLSNNMLRSLPADVQNLTLLSELDLGGNLLDSLPGQLFQDCVKLCILNVSHNNLKSLPSEVSSSRRLCKLDLRFNGLVELPAELGGCPGLHGGGLLVERRLFLCLPPGVRRLLTSEETVEADRFPLYSPTEWRFSSAPESRI